GSRTMKTLLTLGNAKLGDGIFAFSLPAVTSCPGSTPTCRKECYALRGHFPLQARRFRRNLKAAREERFAARMIREITRRFVGCVRIHVAGDFFSADYVRAWAAVARACPQTRFYAYTRSWRHPEIAVALAELARLPNVRLWWSADKDTAVPDRTPRRVRLCWM